MSQQGESPATADDWWNRLYDETVEDQRAAATGDSLDDRFDSVADTVNEGPNGAPVPEPGTDSSAPGAEPVPASGPVPDPAARQPVSAPGSQDTSWPLAAPEPRDVPGSGPVPDSGSVQDPAVWPPVPAPGPLAAPEPRDVPGSGPVPDTGSVRNPAAPPPVSAPESQDAPRLRAPWEPPHTFPNGLPVRGAEDAPEQGQASGTPPRADEQVSEGGRTQAPRLRPATTHVGDGPPTYDAEPTALPAAHPDSLGGLTADTVLEGAGYGSYTLRATSVRGDWARYRGEPRRDALLTARFGSGAGALVLVAVAGGARGSDRAHLAAADACRWIGGAIGRSQARLSEDIRAGRRSDLASGLHRLTGRGYGKLRARAAELGLDPADYTASLRCLLLSGDPDCRTRVFFGVGDGGLFRLRDGAWQDLEPLPPERSAVTGAAVVGFGPGPAGTPGGRPTMDLAITTPPSPYAGNQPPPPSEPFRFRASVARPGDTLLLCSAGLADPLRGEPALAEELAGRWGPAEPPGLAAFLADTQVRVKGYADDRTAAAVWEA